MEKQYEDRTQMDAAYLMACALHGVCPQWEPPADLDPLFRFCQMHSVTAMVTMALELWWKDHPAGPEQMKPWKQARDMAVRKNILLNAERQRLLDYMESVGCWYMPMKGSLLQYDYPKFGMRQMSDNDILVDPAFRDQLRQFMLEQGYEAPGQQPDNHNEYTKPPVYNFEFHYNLVSSTVEEKLVRAYADIRPLLIPDENRKYGYHLSCEEFYVYMMAHAYKHAVSAGTGIRTLSDVYVYRWKHPEMDRQQVDDRLEELGILEFSQDCADFGTLLFADPKRPELTEPERKKLQRFMAAGTHGNRDTMVENGLDQLSQTESQPLFFKIRYMFSRLFLSPKVVMAFEPEIRDHPWKLIPYYLKRLFRAIFRQPKTTLREMGKILRYRKEK